MAYIARNRLLFRSGLFTGQSIKMHSRHLFQGILLSFLLAACQPGQFVPFETRQVVTMTPATVATLSVTSTSERQLSTIPSQEVGAPSPTGSPSPPVADKDCLEAAFITDVSIPDGTAMDPDEIFLKIWRLNNMGDCRWPDDLVLDFIGGDPMGTNQVVPVEFFPAGAPIVASLGERSWADLKLSEVGAGVTVDLPLMLQAPAAGGDHVSLWSIKSMGSGEELIQVYVQIHVEENQTPEPTIWGGTWFQKNQHIGELPVPLFLQQRALQVRGYFYTVDGRLFLLEGGVFDQGLRVAGTFGPPYHDGFPFEWRLLDEPNAFRGIFHDQVISRGAWCGARDQRIIPGPCALDPLP
jgi:hypothetical protein